LAGSRDLEKSVLHLQDENTRLKKQVEELSGLQVSRLKDELKSKAEQINGFTFIGASSELNSSEALKKLAYDLRNEIDNLVGVLGASIENKAHLCIIISDNLVNEKALDAGKMIRTISKEINGGGGGQKFFATAGGSNPAGINKAINAARNLLQSTANN
jgi:alanyl-tRNA synthetase